LADYVHYQFTGAITHELSNQNIPRSWRSGSISSIDTESSEYESSCDEYEWQGVFVRDTERVREDIEDPLPKDFVWRKWDFMDEPENDSGYSS
jgi:hypothetical protein